MKRFIQRIRLSGRQEVQSLLNVTTSNHIHGLHGLNQQHFIQSQTFPTRPFVNTTRRRNLSMLNLLNKNQQILHSGSSSSLSSSMTTSTNKLDSYETEDDNDEMLEDIDVIGWTKKIANSNTTSNSNTNNCTSNVTIQKYLCKDNCCSQSYVF